MRILQHSTLLLSVLWLSVGHSEEWNLGVSKIPVAKQILNAYSRDRIGVDRASLRSQFIVSALEPVPVDSTGSWTALIIATRCQ